MTEFWIADPEGRKARVLTAEAADEYVRVHGWTETTPPEGLEFQHVRNEHPDHHGRGVMNHEALALHGGLGWVACGPPDYDDPAPAPVPKSVKSGTAGEKKEQADA